MAARKPRSFQYLNKPIADLRALVSKGRKRGKRNSAAEYALRMRTGKGTAQERRGHGPTTKTREKQSTTPPRRRTFAAAAIYHAQRPAGRAIAHRRKYGRAEGYIEYDLRGLTVSEKAAAIARARRTLKRWITRYERRGRRVSFYLTYISEKYVHPKSGRVVQREARERFGDGWELAHSVGDLDYALDEIAERFEGDLQKLYIGVL